MRMFIFVASTVAISWFIPTLSVSAQEPVTPSPTEATSDEATEPTEKSMDFWMQKKLDYSGAILRGLALNDFEMIETNARRMRTLNKIEGFVKSRNPQYRQQVRIFDHVTSDLITQAKKENTDGVTLAFNHLTVSCVRCHETLRHQSDTDVQDEKE